MTLQFGSGVAQTFTSTPVTGTPSIAIGNGTFGGGAAPDFQGKAAIGINMAAGYADNALSFQIAGVSILRIAGDGGIFSGNELWKIDSGGNIGAITLGDVAATTPYISFNNAGQITVINRGPTDTGMIFRGAALQTADLIQNQDSDSVNQLGVANKGTGVAPVWALRVAPTASAASMAQTHTIGAATGKAIQVIDNAGTTIGWIPLNA